MKLSELEKGQKAIINKISLQQEIKERLMSMGICIGATIKVCRKTLNQDSLHVTLDCAACLALSRDEAVFIEVTPVGGNGFGFRKKFRGSNAERCCEAVQDERGGRK